jgi:hypothetical protein
MTEMTPEIELRAVWRAITELADGVPGAGVENVRRLLAAADQGLRDDSFWTERFPRPKSYPNGLPTPPAFDANRPRDAERDAVEAAASRGFWDRITGAGS